LTKIKKLGKFGRNKDVLIVVASQHLNQGRLIDDEAARAQTDTTQVAIISHHRLSSPPNVKGDQNHDQKLKKLGKFGRNRMSCASITTPQGKLIDEHLKADYRRRGKSNSDRHTATPQSCFTS